MREYKLLKLNTARNALKYIINAFKIKEIYIPYYICPLIRNVIIKENCSIKFYHLDKNFRPLCSFPPDGFILYPDYFGICGIIIDELLKIYPNLIIDNAHAFFSEPKGKACFYSLRKFFPKLRDGAFLYTTKTANINMEKDNFKYEYCELSYEELCKNEIRLDKENIKYMSDYTLSYFSKINLNEEKQKYIDNFRFYEKKYGINNNLEINISLNTAPYKYPYLAQNIEQADEIVKELAKDGKIIFKYWNNMPDSYIEKDFYNKLVAI